MALGYKNQMLSNKEVYEITEACDSNLKHRQQAEVSTL